MQSGLYLHPDCSGVWRTVSEDSESILFSHATGNREMGASGSRPLLLSPHALPRFRACRKKVWSAFVPPFIRNRSGLSCGLPAPHAFLLSQFPGTSSGGYSDFPAYSQILLRLASLTLGPL